jgi:hypothetical protein
VSLSKALDEYKKDVDLWLEAAKKQVAAVTRLQKAVQAGNVRDFDKNRSSALAAGELAVERAEACGEFDFDMPHYLGKGYAGELKAAAEKAGVRLYERDGVIFCYPVLVRIEPDLTAVRIDKKLDPNLRPEELAARLKKAQSGEAKERSDRFIETLLEAYNTVRIKKDRDAYIDVALFDIYKLLTLLPGAAKEYTLLDFTRDIYFLDISGIVETKSGWRLSLPASTVSRERGIKILPFVTRDGHEKQYAAVRFTPPNS